MPILTYSSSEGPRGGILNSRVLIGRRLTYGIAFSDPSVSRLHAWIDPVPDEHAGWQIADAGSKTGTFVNDQKITRHHLQDGDVIRVGKSTLVYHDQETLPDGVTHVDLIAPPPLVLDSGILFQCTCGAPLWVGNELAGKRGMCRHCRQPVTVPKLEADIPAPQQPILAEPALPPVEVSRTDPPPAATESEQVDEPPPAASRIDPDPIPAAEQVHDLPLAASRIETPPIEESESVDEPPLADSLIESPPIAGADPESPDASSSASPQIDEPAVEEYETTDQPQRDVAEKPPVEESEVAYEEATASPPAAEHPSDARPPKKVAPPVMVDESTKKKFKCAVCHSSIVVGEEMITCPDCAMTFHAECWQENLGCSSYGCPQVNCLQTRPRSVPTGGLLSESDVVEETGHGSRVGIALLAASVAASILGALLFGALDLVIILMAVVVLIRGKTSRSGAWIAALVICVFGIAGDLAVSDFYYFNAQHIPPMILKYLHF
jgi:hypothetical protein